MRPDYTEIVKKCLSKSDFCRALGLATVGSGWRKANSIIVEYKLCISHFNRGMEKYAKYKKITKICPACDKEFTCRTGGSEARTTCSHACSNTHFRSGSSNPNWKESRYRSTCFLYHKKECVICGENKLIDVHHYDENNKNNSAENLIPLCPTHHAYCHSRYKNEVIGAINEYRESFIKTRL